jgi:uncharacterized protein YlxP (DUF503 family)
MHVGICTIRFEVVGSGSLKEKRQVVRKIKERSRQRFNISIAEVGDLGSRSVAELGIACVSNEARHVQSVLTHVGNYIEEEFASILVLDVETELL